jgi:hypothetical protein
MFAIQSKQDLKALPLHIIHEKVSLAGRNAVSMATKMDDLAHERFLERKMKEYNDQHEAPFEGDISEMWPATGTSAEYVAEQKAEAEALAMEEVLTYLGLKNKAGWLLPQMSAYISKMTLPRNEVGKILPKEFLQINFGKDDWHRGLYRLSTLAKRGSLVTGQYKEEGRNYSALVPLLMMPFKKFDGIGYEEWDKPNLNHVLDPNLFDAITCNAKITLTADELLENRKHGLLIKSGVKEGQARSPTSTFKLYGHLSEEIRALPWLAQVMVSQIWMAHPSNRTELMILDWNNWDSMPKALIDTDLVLIPKKKVYQSTTMDLGWE